MDIEATVTSTARTGVEMEALTAVSVAGLALYDMCKAVDKGMVIGEGGRVVKRIGTHAQQLLTQIGRRIDQDARALVVGDALDQRCASPPPVLRIGRVAGAPHGAYARHTT